MAPADLCESVNFQLSVTSGVEVLRGLYTSRVRLGLGNPYWQIRESGRYEDVLTEAVRNGLDIVCSMVISPSITVTQLVDSRLNENCALLK